MSLRWHVSVSVSAAATLAAVTTFCTACSGTPSGLAMSAVSGAGESDSPPVATSTAHPSADAQDVPDVSSPALQASAAPSEAPACDSLTAALESWTEGRDAYKALEKLQALTVLTRVAAKSHEWDTYYKVVSKQIPSLIRRLPDRLVPPYQPSDVEDCADAAVRRRVAGADKLPGLLTAFKREMARQTGDIGDVGAAITTVRWMYERNGEMITNDGDKAVTDLVLKYSVPPLLHREKAFLLAARDAGFAAS